jgi:hypothetical protein
MGKLFYPIPLKMCVEIFQRTFYLYIKKCLQFKNIFLNCRIFFGGELNEVS